LKASLKTVYKNKVYISSLPSSKKTGSSLGRKVDLKILSRDDIELCCCEFKATDEKWKKEKQLSKSIRLNKSIASSLDCLGINSDPLYAMDWNGTIS
jgi:hypothetical protein